MLEDRADVEIQRTRARSVESSYQTPPITRQRALNGGMTMASERQIAANRLNARKSTGPRSGTGKKRASGNAYRHGLTLNITSTAALAEQLDKLAREIAGDSEDAILLGRARAVAQAELELARVRRAKVALIERASAFGELDPPRVTVTQMIQLLNAFERGRPMPKAIDASATMPSQEPERLAEASDGCCHNCASSTDTSAALLRSESERFSSFLVE
jgi:hypothetical protein